MMRVMVACCLLVSTIALADESFGRLFTTPAERANLDYLRKITKDVSAKEKQEQVNVMPIETVEDKAPELPAPISMQGFVKRSDGKKGTVWINHQAILESSRHENLSIGKLSNDKSEVEIKLSNGQHFPLKAGQVYEVTSNKRQETVKPEKN